MSSLPPEAISAVINLGLKLATTAIERRAQCPLASMTAEDVVRLVSEIEVRSADELIAEGQRRANTPDLD